MSRGKIIIEKFFIKIQLNSTWIFDLSYIVWILDCYLG